MNKNQIRLIGGIGPGGINAASVQRALAGCYRGPVAILLDSPGGRYGDAIATIEALKAWPWSVSIHVCGQADSSAALLVASFPSTCEPTARFLLHRPTIKPMDDDEDLSREACEIVQAEYVTILASRLNLNRCDIIRLMAMSVELTAQEAFNLKLVNRIEQREIVRYGATSAIVYGRTVTQRGTRDTGAAFFRVPQSRQTIRKALMSLGLV